MKYTIAASMLVMPFAAQTSEGPGFSVRIGPSFPLDADTRDMTASIGYNAGLRYALPFPGLLTSLIGTTSGIDLEGFQASDGSDRINYLGLTYFEQVRMASRGSVTPYAGLGIGAYRIGVDVKSTVTTTEIIDLGSGVFDEITTTETVKTSDNGIRFGGRAMIGVELPANLFVEASLVIISKLDGANASTINLAAGISF